MSITATHFMIDGEFVCDLARSWFWEENRGFEKSEKLLLSCMVTDQVTEEEKKRIVVEILEGRKKLIGKNALSLVEDNECIRPLSEKIMEYQKADAIRRIEEDIQRRPRAYLDPYSCNKNPADYCDPIEVLTEEGRQEIAEAFGAGELSPYWNLRLWAFSSYNVWYRKAWILPEFWNEDGWDILKNGFFLIQNPKLVYQLIGGPVRDSEELFSRLTSYLEDLLERKTISESDRQIILHRNRLQMAAQEKQSSITEAEEKRNRNSDQLNAEVSPDDFLSEYGLIDPMGNYYSCSFAGHHTKAFNILVSRNIEVSSFDEALDKLYSEGWAIIRNPDPGGSVFFDYRSDRRPTKRQIDAAFSHMIKFGERTLSGIKQYLED